MAGYPGHPIDAERRALGEPDDDQVVDITLEDDVWLATGSTFSASITIGRATIFAAGVLAQVKRKIEHEDKSFE